ncbi:MAG: electron transfer flavoprotein subunit alpha/FixB family protein, partial [Flavicella sp.]
MAILVFAEATDGKYKKIALEAISYGKQLADKIGSQVIALTINAETPDELSRYGAQKIIQVNQEDSGNFNAKVTASIIQQVAVKENANVIIMDASSNGLYAAPIVAASLEAGYASNVVALPTSTSPFIVKRKAFSNKAFATTEMTTEVK